MTKIATLYGLIKLHSLGVFSIIAELFGYVARFIGDTIGFTECSYNFSCGKFIIFYLIFTSGFFALAIYEFTKYKNKKRGALVVGGASLIFIPIFLLIGSPIPQINYFLPKGEMLWVMSFVIAFIGATISKMGGKLKLSLLYVVLSLLMLLVLLTISTSSGQCIKGDCKNGYGTKILANGRQYVGEFKDSKIHGQGTYTYTSGDKHVGEYKDGKRHGQGTYTKKWPFSV